MSFYKKNILETIGNTPLVKLNSTVEDISALVLGKIETFNPGHSIKDRMAVKMVNDAEKNGKLKAGGTIIECTSGNTGMGLAMIAAVRGYRCIFTTNDKQSKEKIDMLKALGAEVIVCPTAVTPDDPKSYYSVAKRLDDQISNSFWCNQYDNLSNKQAHYESTGPEIWEQTNGKITHLIVGVGTGGTISGTAKYLKEKNPNIQIWGIDTYGSVFKKYHETGKFDPDEIYPYITEGIGEDILPKNVDFSLIDHFEKVSDKDGALFARKLAREEGLLLGYSAGSAVAGLLQMKDQLSDSDVVVIVFHDHGSRYVGKIYNDEWMQERGFLTRTIKVRDVISNKAQKGFISVQANDTIQHAFELMKENDISQLPVEDKGEMVGSVSEHSVLTFLLENPGDIKTEQVGMIIDAPFPIVSVDLPCNQLSKHISKKITAVMAKDKTGTLHIITQYDIIQSM